MRNNMQMINSALNYTVKLIATLIIGLLMYQNVSAESDDATFFGHKASGNWIIGLKLAQIDLDFSDTDADALGAILGYEYDLRLDGGGTTTIELEYLTSDETNFRGLGNYDGDVWSLFFTYRSAGTLYFKAKAGASSSDFIAKTPTTNFTYKDTTLAGGIGLGYHVGDLGTIEVEYSLDAGDSQVGILGLNILFEF